MGGKKPYKIQRIVAQLFVVGMTAFFFTASSSLAVDALLTSEQISAIQVKILKAPKDRQELHQMATRLILFRKGDPFDEARLQKSIDRLKLCKRFSDIHVDTKAKEAGLLLVFTLTRAPVVKDIKIQGEYPLFEQEILTAMTIFTGSTFSYLKLSKQAALVSELFIQHGFVGPKVEVSANEDQEDGYYIVRVNIDPGAHYSLSELFFKGNRSFSDTRLKWKMKVYTSSIFRGRLGRFVQEDLNKDIKYLTRFYLEKGFADVSIRSQVRLDPATRKAAITVIIEEGPQYAIAYVGNEAFWDMTLDKDLSLFRVAGHREFKLRGTVKKIKARYRQEGYNDVAVTIQKGEKRGAAQRTYNLKILIKEGPQTLVKKIVINGNQAFSTAKIEKQMLLTEKGLIHNGYFLPETLSDDLFAIQSLYRNNGYVEAKVTHTLKWSQDRTFVTVLIHIVEGPQMMVGEVRILGVEAQERQALQRKVIQLKAGEPFRPYLIMRDKNAISAWISEKGFPHVKVTRTTVKDTPGADKRDVIFNVAKGPYVEMGDIYFKGNFRTQPYILENELDLKKGAPFSLKRMLEGQHHIRSIKAFKAVQFNTFGLREEEDCVDLHITVEERKPYYIQLGMGYESRAGLNANTKTGDHNFLGTNKDAFAAGEISQVGQRLELAVSEPRLFASRISSDISLNMDRRAEFNQDFGTKIWGINVGFNKKTGKDITTGMSFHFEEREKYDRKGESLAGAGSDDGSTFIENEFDPRSILVTTASIRYDTRDSFIRPRKGSYTALSWDISKGIENALDDFIKTRFSSRFYISPFSHVTFAFLGQFNHIEPYGADGEVPEDQLFFLGGTSDVRGFDENLLTSDPAGDPLGGTSSVLGSTEVRFEFEMDFELTCFYDIGRVSHTQVAARTKGFRSSAGIGLRYLTPIGPVGFLYGMKLARIKGESPGRFHFSVGYTF